VVTKAAYGWVIEVLDAGAVQADVVSGPQGADSSLRVDNSPISPVRALAASRSPVVKRPVVFSQLP
jgi:hypothetical protein